MGSLPMVCYKYNQKVNILCLITKIIIIILVTKVLFEMTMHADQIVVVYSFAFDFSLFHRKITVFCCTQV